MSKGLRPIQLCNRNMHSHGVLARLLLLVGYLSGCLSVTDATIETCDLPFDSTTHVCCGSTVTLKSHCCLAVSGGRILNAEPIDPSVSGCCNGETYPVVGDMECCGSSPSTPSLYNSTTAICCESGEYFSIHSAPSASDYVCCGMEKMSTRLEDCCNDVIIEKYGEMQCCGLDYLDRSSDQKPILYNRTEGDCCERSDEKASIITNSSLEECCYGEVYSPDSDVCDDYEGILPKFKLCGEESIPFHHVCCNNSTLDLHQFCCDGVKHYKSSKTKCCSVTNVHGETTETIFPIQVENEREDYECCGSDIHLREEGQCVSGFWSENPYGAEGVLCSYAYIDETSHRCCNGNPYRIDTHDCTDRIIVLKPTTTTPTSAPTTLATTTSSATTSAAVTSAPTTLATTTSSATTSAAVTSATTTLATTVAPSATVTTTATTIEAVVMCGDEQMTAAHVCCNGWRYEKRPYHACCRKRYMHTFYTRNPHYQCNVDGDGVDFELPQILTTRSPSSLSPTTADSSVRRPSSPSGKRRRKAKGCPTDQSEGRPLRAIKKMRVGNDVVIGHVIMTNGSCPSCSHYLLFNVSGQTWTCNSTRTTNYFPASGITTLLKVRFPKRCELPSPADTYMMVAKVKDDVAIRPYMLKLTHRNQRRVKRLASKYIRRTCKKKNSVIS